MKIQVKTARLLSTACTIILDGTHSVVTKLANGDSSSASIPFELDDKARYNLQKNLALARRIVEAADKLRDGILRELAGGAGKNLSQSEQPVKWTQWIERTEKVEDGYESGPFLKVRQSGLKISNSNPIPGSAVVALGAAGVLDEDVAAPCKDDIIPDEPTAAAA